MTRAPVENGGYDSLRTATVPDVNKRHPLNMPGAMQEDIAAIAGAPGQDQLKSRNGNTTRRAESG